MVSIVRIILARGLCLPQGPLVCGGRLTGQASDLPARIIQGVTWGGPDLRQLDCSGLDMRSERDIVAYCLDNFISESRFREFLFKDGLCLAPQTAFPKRSGMLKGHGARLCGDGLVATDCIQQHGFGFDASYQMTDQMQGFA
jgi:hypothetical protein